MTCRQPAVLKDLSPPQTHLVLLMQRLRFGTVENLLVQGGQPCFDPPPRVLRARKFGTAEHAPPPGESSFTIKAPVVELLAELEELGHGTIRCLEVQHGLPFRMTVEEQA